MGRTTLGTSCASWKKLRSFKGSSTILRVSTTVPGRRCRRVPGRHHDYTDGLGCVAGLELEINLRLLARLQSDASADIINKVGCLDSDGDGVGDEWWQLVLAVRVQDARPSLCHIRDHRQWQVG